MPSIGAVVQEFWDEDLPRETREKISPPRGALKRRVWVCLLRPKMAETAPQFPLGADRNPAPAEDPVGLRAALRDLVPWLVEVGHLLGRTWPIALREKFGTPSSLDEHLYRRYREEPSLALTDDALVALLRSEFGEPEADADVSPPSIAGLRSLLARSAVRDLERIVESGEPWPEPDGTPMVAELKLLAHDDWDDQWTEYVAGEPWRWVLGDLPGHFLSEHRSPRLRLAGQSGAFPLDRTIESLVRPLLKRRGSRGAWSVHTDPVVRDMTTEGFVRLVITHRLAVLGLSDVERRSLMPLVRTIATQVGQRNGLSDSRFVEGISYKAQRLVWNAHNNRMPGSLDDLLIRVESAWVSKLWVRLFGNQLRGVSENPKLSLSVTFTSAFSTLLVEDARAVRVVHEPTVQAPPEPNDELENAACLINDAREADARRRPPVDVEPLLARLISRAPPATSSLDWAALVDWHRRTCPRQPERHPDFEALQRFVQENSQETS
ncbi:hypothetical protein B0I31_114136 [Saccharothrix carnea]|uniref:Uncharacterized protein n=1 Tax=Saccharothrix carnea TaxID=1280637 RepID=A0A2P8I1G2_SACCR|nr:hypothetical protein [Saccharothrix carnea]PSL52309.1 hypothetical protein B0I31_114136 [Saccharothrix carnea]